METQIAFITICIASAASPGPGMLAVLSNSINQHLRGTLPVILGISTGLLIASFLSNSWLLTVINTNESAYKAMTWLCSGYIVYLGCKALYYSKSEANIETNTYTYQNGILISLLNPKTLIFFGALFPLFIQPEEAFMLQAAILTIELIIITFVIHVMLSATIDKASEILKKHIVLINRITGLLFIAIGGSGFIV